MPQDSLRSIVYRSLVHCDDPNGVVENETIRKSKTSSRTMEHRNHSRRTRTYSNPSFVIDNEAIINKMVFKRTSDQELQASSPSFQLLKVSRGAQELNQMIDTWSKGMNTHGQQSKDIARDLLRGALDLQESLVMLCKLQDASKHMAKSKRKQKLKSRREADEVVDVQRVDSTRYELQNPRLSIGESSRNCTEELRKIIRESLSRQNLLTIPAAEENVYPNQTKMDSVSDIPSTSSSQSSVVYSNVSVSFDSSSIAQQKKAKAPSVIAKLMGLEEFPSKSIQTVPKQTDSKKNLNQRKPIFNIEKMPKPRKTCCLDEDEDEDTERKTLKEIIETMHFKGLLKSNNHVEEHKFGSQLSDTSSCSGDEMPPIVIMKPLRFPREETEVSLVQQSIWEEGPSRCTDSITEQEGREEPLNQSFVQEEEAVESKEIVVKQEEKQETAKTLNRNDDALKTKNMSRKLAAKAEPPMKRSFRKDRASTSNEILKKKEPKESKTMEKAATNKMKASSVVQSHKQKTENPNKKVMKMEVLPKRRKPVEKAAATVPRSQEQVRATIIKSRKVENGLSATKDHMHLQDRTIQNPITKRSVKSVPHNAIDQTKKVRTRKAKPVTEPMPDRSNIKALQRKDGNKEIRLVDKLTNVSSTRSILLGDQQPTGEQMKGLQIQIEDHREEEQCVSREVTIQFDPRGSGIKSAEEAKKLLDKKSTFNLTKTNLKELLRSSPSFLNYAEDLFDLNINQPMLLQTAEVKDIDVVSSRLILDCANELMEYKSRWTSHVFHPLLRTHVRNLRTDISLEELVEEICDGVEKFRDYSKVDDDFQVQHVDSLFKMLEIDIKSEGMMGNGGWDLGWINGFSVNEADQVVGEMEKQVLSELLEEVIIDLLC